MRYLMVMAAALVALSGCVWETYQDADGHTALRQKYEKGTRVYYQDGSYSHNMNYNQYRPERHAVRPQDSSEEENVRGTSWDKTQKQ